VNYGAIVGRFQVATLHAGLADAASIKFDLPFSILLKK